MEVRFLEVAVSPMFLTPPPSAPFKQAKASLTKPWLATDDANCSPAFVREQFARR